MTRLSPADVALLTRTHSAAAGAWKTASWIHNYIGRDGSTTVCKGGCDDCNECQNAEHDAMIAEIEAVDALRHALNGDLESAFASAQAASMLERRYGFSLTGGVWIQFMSEIAILLETALAE